MIKPQLAALIAQLELTSKRLLSGSLLGDSLSKLKGSGFEFNQLRDYQQGDDIRFIDWKSSARSQRMLVRQYVEDKNRTVYLLLDCSASTDYGSTEKLKYTAMAELAAILAFVALHTKDSVGLILFNSTVELIIPARSTRAHVLTLISKIVTYIPKNTDKQAGTNITVALKALTTLKTKNVLVCIISDFMEDLDMRVLGLYGQKYDILGFKCLDKCEKKLPHAGFLTLQDSETEEQALFDMRTTGVLKLDALLDSWHKDQETVFRKLKIDLFVACIGQNYYNHLAYFLKHRYITSS